MTDEDEYVPKPYRVETAMRASRDEVWESITQPPVIRQWFGWDYEGLDAEIRQIFVDEAILTAPERMGWSDGSYLEVAGDDDTSVIRAVRDGEPEAGEDRYDPIEEGWRSFLVQLRFLLDERPAGRRRTVYLTGQAAGAAALAAVGDGRDFATAPRQRALVDADGHLVVVATHVPVDDADPGRVEVTVSTYGLDDGAFDAVHRRWADRWRAAVADADVTIAGEPAQPDTIEDFSAA